MLGPTPLDLCTVNDLIQWIFGANSGITAQQAGILQSALSALSLDVLRRTGRGSQNSSVPTQSPFVNVVSYNENYTGNGNELLGIRNWPVNSVSAVTVFGNAIQQSTVSTMPGWFIESSGRYLGARFCGAGYPQSRWWTGGLAMGRAGLGSGGGWPQGIDCINVQYIGGFAAQPVSGELQTVPALPAAWSASTAYANGAQIFDGANVQQAQLVQLTAQSAVSGPATPAWSAVKGNITPDGSYILWVCMGKPYVVTVNQLPWVSDEGVTYFSSGIALVPVAIAPSAGQYYPLGGGQYLFNAADSTREVQISYLTSGCPYDLRETMLRWVNLIYKRRGWEGLRSISQKDAGTTSYTGFDVDPSFEQVFANYRRRR
jgi:hypothetical protein